jgi:cellulose synthase/poly-beta-1,6-N-acetylglucosamine synthase-like glycosyltransferase
LDLHTLTLTAPQKILLGLYFLLWLIFAALGLRRYWMLWLYRKTRHRSFCKGEFATLPRITVQLPVYNELYVIRRLLRSVAALDYPRDLLEIQVLDDSSDDTVRVAAEEIAQLQAEGIQIHHLRRPDRIGYKAGALAYGMKRATGELLLIFDADFVPRPDLLRQILPYVADPEVGMVQVRWDHLNAEYSLLARIQSISLDGHFVIEHDARAKNGLFFNFNGTAGMWRKACIEDAGGWQHDTLTEDLDLSYRAQLKGWKFVFLRDVTCPSELPIDMKSFKSQQYRWVKGSVQVAKKILPPLWRSPLPLMKKIESTVHLVHNMTYLLVLLLSLLVYPAVLFRYTSSFAAAALIELPLFLFATVSLFIFYGTAQTDAHGAVTWKKQAKYFPALMSIAIGLSVNNSRALLEGLFGKTTPFHRTPKFNVTGRTAPHEKPLYQALPSWTSVLELLLGLYFACILVLAVREGYIGAIPFVVLFLFGYLYVGLTSMDLKLPRLRRS